MTFTEFLTLYLAIGAPFGVYFFLKERGDSFNLSLFLKSTGAALFWFFLAARLVNFRLFLNRVTLSGANSDCSHDLEITSINQNLQNAFTNLTEFDKTISFFEFREVLERYIGLTLALQSASMTSSPPEHELEIFRVAGREKRDLQLAGKITHRRNYLRLQTHQLRASHNFIEVCRILREKLLTQSNGKLGAWQQYQIAAQHLVELLEDAQTSQKFRKLYLTATVEQQPPTNETNSKQERDLWINLQPRALIKTFPTKISSHTVTTEMRD